MVSEFRQRRDRFVQALNTVPGFTCAVPEGAFYAFPGVSSIPLTSDEVANSLLMRGGVACLSGSAFGQNGAGYVRFSLANSMNNLDLAIDKILRWRDSI